MNEVKIWARSGEWSGFTIFNVVDNVPTCHVKHSFYVDLIKKQKVFYTDVIVKLVNVSNGNERFYCNGVLHRLDGPAVNEVNKIEYHFEGRLHREDGPARIWDGGFVDGGGESWWFNGLKHRDPKDGPAHLSKKRSPPYTQFWFEGKQIYNIDVLT